MKIPGQGIFTGGLQEASKLTTNHNHSLLPFTKISYCHLCLASLSLRWAVAKPDAAYISAADFGPPRCKRHQAWRPFNEVTLG